MDSWEFLLQKKGTRTWLPLQTHRVSVGTGYYRLVAQGCPPQIDVEIQVFYQTLDPEHPQRRSQKRSGQTSQKGLIVVVPFTDFRPGMWELRLSSPQMREQWGEDWQEVIQLKVKPSPTPKANEIQGEASVPPEAQAESRFTAPQFAESESSELATPPALSEPVRTDKSALALSQFDLHKEPETVGSTLDFPDFMTDGVPSLEEALGTPLPSPIASSDLDAEPSPAPEVATDDSEPEMEVMVEGDDADIALTPEILTEDAIGYQQPLRPSPLPTSGTAEAADALDTPHALLEQSIQSLEQMLQQVSEPGENLVPTESAAPVPEFLTEPPRSPELVEPPEPTEALTPWITSPLQTELPQLSITLAQETFVRRRDEPILISGHVDALDPEQPNLLDQGFAGCLRYELRDPQTQESLMAVEQPLHDATLPLVFNYLLDVPTAYATRLILGEVSLAVTQPMLMVDETEPLVHQTFSITAGLDDLLDTVRQIPMSQLEPEAPTQLQLPTAPKPEPAIADPWQSNLKLSSSPAAPTPQPAPASILPPKLPQPGRKSRKSLELPSFGNPPPHAQPGGIAPFGTELPTAAMPTSSPDPLAPLDSTPAESRFAAQEEPPVLDSASLHRHIAPPEPDVDLEAAFTAWPDAGTADALPPMAALDPEAIAFNSGTLPDTPPMLTEPSLPIPELQMTSPSVTDDEADIPPAGWQDDEDDNEDTEEELIIDGDAIDGFQALQLQDRFLRQINRLADIDSAALPNSQDKQNRQGRQHTGTKPAPTLEPKSGVWDRGDWPMQEFVVDDESDPDPVPPPQPTAPLAPPAHDASGLPYPQQLQTVATFLHSRQVANASALAKSPPASAPEPLTISTPELELPQGELTAGDLVLVRVTLPPQEGVVYVKLWVKDCETRQLLDGPRAFVDFDTTPTGELETMTQVIVPMGSQAIRFEAITIDVTTGQESRKASCDRAVIPPDFQQFNFEGLAELPLSEN